MNCCRKGLIKKKEEGRWDTQDDVYSIVQNVWTILEDWKFATWVHPEKTGIKILARYGINMEWCVVNILLF